MIKKRFLVEQAYAELALAGYQFDLDPAEIQFGLQRLEFMIAEWSEAWELDVGYLPASDLSEIDPDDDSGLTAGKVRAIALNLAVEIAQNKGKQVSPLTLNKAAQALSELQIHTPATAVNPDTLPVGAGNKPGLLYNTFFTGQ